MSLPGFSVKHPITTTMLFLGLSGLGLVSLSSIGQELFPRIALPTIMAVTVSPGVGPYDMEQKITKEIEGAAASLGGVTGITSTSMESVSQVVVQYENGTSMDKAMVDFREAVSRTGDDFPEGTDTPMLFVFEAGMLPSLRINIYSKTPGLDLKSLLEDTLVPRLDRIQGVSRVNLFGGADEAVMVYVDPDRLRNFQIPAMAILNSFRGENAALPGGTIRLEDRNVNLRTDGTFQTIEDIGSVVIGSRGDSPVYLRDVATIDRGPLAQEQYLYTGDYEAIRLSIQKQPGTNTIEVNQAVLDAIELVKKDLPSSTQFEIVEDQANQVRAVIGGVADSAWQGGLLAILVLLFFLRNVRSTIIVATTIPLSVVATFALMNYADLTMNISSMMGLTLAIGMFVDNAIVVVESIYRKLLLGYNPRDAAILGSEEVGPAITASTLTTLAVFVPMLFVGGLAGVLFKDLALTISFSLAVSLVAALTFIPMASSKLLKVKALPGFVDGKQVDDNPKLDTTNHLPGNAPPHHLASIEIDDISLADVEVQTKSKTVNAFGKGIQKSLYWLDNTYENLISWALKHPYKVILTSFGLLIGSVLTVVWLGMEFIPETDDGMFNVSFETRLGATYDETTQKARQIEGIIREEAGDTIVTISSAIGDGGSNYGQTAVTLKTKEQRNYTIWDLTQRVDTRVANEVTDVSHTTNVEGMAALATMSSGSSNPIVISLIGDDIDSMYSYAQYVQETIEQIPGTRNVQISHKVGKPELVIRVKRQEAVSLGISPYEIAVTLRSLYAGTALGNFTQGETQDEIRLIMQDQDRNDLERIKSIFFVTNRGQTIALENLVELQEEAGPVAINRKDRARIIDITASTNGDLPLNTVMASVQKSLKTMTQPSAGIEMELGGSGTEMADSFSSLFVALMAAVALVYMVMASQFESLLNPLIIMFSIPFAAIGLILALIITNTTFNILSFTGAILLAGVVVNNAIVLIDYITILRKRGTGILHAIIHGGKTRLKPILMSTGTTIIGLIPMAMGIGAGAELQAPMARAVVGGLLTSTLITLVLIPVIYWLVETRWIPFFTGKHNPAHEIPGLPEEKKA